MKKWIIGILVIFLVAVAAVYIFIPSKMEISESEYIPVPSDAVYRFLSDKNNWAKWWPATSERQEATKDSFNYDDVNYSISYRSINVVEVALASKHFKSKTQILVVPLDDDSTAVHWRFFTHSGNNPISKIQNYQRARQLEENMENILQAFSKFMGRQENIYNLDIREERVTDTILVSTSINTVQYPTMEEVYDMINSIKRYISSKGASQTNPPMLNILKVDSGKFVAMVAIPVDKKIENYNDFTYKRMVAGRILVAEVRGGIHRVDQALTQMENYVKDYRLKSPAIPFQSLVTDRLSEPDTTKWITRIYYPIL